MLSKNFRRRIKLISHRKEKGFICKYFSGKNTTDSFMTGTSSIYIEQMYLQWKKDRTSVHTSWDSYFSNLENGVSIENSFQSPPSLTGCNIDYNLAFSGIKSISASANISSNTVDSSIIKVLNLIKNYQSFGYLKADLDPLKLINSNLNPNIMKDYKHIEKLDYKYYGFSDADLEKEFNVHTDKVKGILSEQRPLKLKEILAKLNKAYCSTIGVEHMFITNAEESNYLRDKFEIEWINYKPSLDEKLLTFQRVAWSVLFEEFLHTKFNTHKRFGLEGLETLVSGLNSMIDNAVQQGCKDVTLGMAHRGRLNVLTNVFNKPLSKLFGEFQGKWGEHDHEWEKSGDVKYHLGAFHQKSYPDGKSVNLVILPNPSHLEAVNPVVQGYTRAKQHYNKDENRNEVIPILVHGDASFAGQGIVYETFQMQDLNNYETGGVIHIISNNQVGFTTSPKDARSTAFSSALGKAYEMPIIHVNADDAFAVDYAFKVALEFRNKFLKDVIVDLIGYRRNGHNELDQPSFTQPLMYDIITKHPNVLKIVENNLLQEGVEKTKLDKIKESIKVRMEEEFINATKNNIDFNEHVPLKWKEMANYTKEYSPVIPTGVNLEKLRDLGRKINTLPKDFNPHAQVKKIYENRLQSINDGKGLDWATAEALAWGTLLEEGYTVRISGQDVERGTFSHRHSVLNDQKQLKRYVPLYTVCKDTSNFQPSNSFLSEYSVLGYELGFSFYDPKSLVMWEAQFGDFANGAQIIIDQFISAGETKWNIASGLVLLLPHGMDGQGPEHSSCRIERFLQLMDDDPRIMPNLNSDQNWNIQKTNMQVCNPSSSSNYFHLLRRQVKRKFRKPLIIPAPKKLLRLKNACSNLDEFVEGLFFQKVKKDNEALKNPKSIKKVLVCSGQVYHDLIAERTKLKRSDVAIITLEQIAPFPYQELHEVIKSFSNAQTCWVQEEHMNQGSWDYVEPRMNNLLKFCGRNAVQYIGRNPSSSPAAGHQDSHEKELAKLLKEAFI